MPIAGTYNNILKLAQTIVPGTLQSIVGGVDVFNSDRFPNLIPCLWFNVRRPTTS